MRVRHVRHAVVALAGAAALALQALPARAGAQPPDPRLSWRTIATPHFRVHFPAELEEQGRRAAANAERAWAQLAAELAPPRGTVDLVVGDNVDYSQGYATPFPSNRIVVFAQPPVDEPSLRFYDDWSQLVITHELTHVFHLDRVRGGWRALQWVFGRNPVLFPNSYAPSWLTEGLAVHYESRLTGAGRLVGTQHRLFARAAALDHALPRLDELSLASTEFPGGQKAYAYGSLLVDHMARVAGERRMRSFVDFTAGQLIPWRLNWAGRRMLGQSFRAGYRRWRDSLEAATPGSARRALGDSLGGVRRELTDEPWNAEYPRWLDDGSIVYAANDARDLPGAYRVTPDGRRERVGRRNSLGPNVPLADGRLLFAQLDYVDLFTLRSDLFAQRSRDGGAEFGTASGGQTRLTRGARLSHPDARRDGAVVAVQTVGGTTRLVRVSADGRTVAPLTAAHPDTQWAEPRWSPNGLAVAAVRLERGGVSSVVVLDTAGAVRRVLARERAVSAAPSWSANGLFWSSDRSGVPQVYGAPVTEASLADGGGDPATARLSAVPGGVFQPVPSPATGELAAMVLRGDGYHLALLGRDSADAAAERPSYAQETRVPPVARDSSPARAYSPWRTLVPRYWTPLVTDGDASTTLYGAGTTGNDVLGRHAYVAQALVNGTTRDVDALLAWSYARFGQPLVTLTGAQTWDYGAVRVQTTGGGSSVVDLDRRERSVTGALTFRRPRYRTASSLSLGASYEHRSYRSTAPTLPALADASFGSDFPTVFASAGWSNARRALRGISFEDGLSLSAYAENRWGNPDGASRLAIASGRAYKSLPLPGFAKHALAVRVAGGATDARATNELSAGGVSGSAAELLPGLVVGTSARTFGVRGFPSGVRRGTRAAAASAEYRAPLALPSRGLDLLPAFLDRVSVAAFGDAGTAWCPTAGGESPPLCQSLGGLATTEAEWLASVGAELDLDAALQYDAPIRFRLGAAVPVSHRELANASVVGYLTLGLSF